MTTMTIARLRIILDAYGAAPERWPETERAAALALIAQAPEARAAVAAASALDATLGAYPNPAENAINPLKLVAAITAQPQLGQPLRPQAKPPARITIGWPNFAGLAAAAIAGFLVGWSGLDRSVLPAPPTNDTAQTLFGDPPEDWTW
jgi:hypothetical protein